MRLVFGVLVGALALVTGTAAAWAIELPPPPTLPTPTVPTVTVPLPPPPTVPAPPLPPPPAPAPTPPPLPKPPPPVDSVTNQTQTTATSVTQTAAGAAGAVTGASSSGSAAGGASTGSATGASGGTSYSGSATTSGGSAAASSGSAATSGGSASASRSSRGMRVDHFQSSRRWIGTTGSKNRRTTRLTFVLPHAGRVILTVRQVSPQCVGIGHLSVRGHAGINRIRFAGRVRGHQLEPGTYRISIRTPSGQVVRRVTLVVVEGSAPSRDELQALRAANTCPAQPQQASLISAGSSVVSASSGPPTTKAQGEGGLAVAAPTGSNLHSGVLGSSIEETARALRPVLVVLLALSILLLAVASLPRYAVAGPRVHDVLARHRIEIAGLGAVALVAVAVAFFIG
jgi:hypothetical protein